MSESIKIMFTCKLCGLTRVEVQVPTRPSDMDLLFWMNKIVLQRVMTTHGLKSLLCEATEVDLYLPANGEWVGSPGSDRPMTDEERKEFDRVCSEAGIPVVKKEEE